MKRRIAALPAPVAGWPVVAFEAAEGGTALTAPQLARIQAEALWWPVPRHDASANAAGVPTDLSRLLPAGALSVSWPDNHSAMGFLRFAMLDLDDLPPLRWVCPWRGHDLPPDEGLEALSVLAAAARANHAPCHLIGMSPWKRRCVSPFLTGPHGPPSRTPLPGSRPVVWGAASDTEGARDVLRIEDGFLRSVGLGLRHTPPASLTFDTTAPYFDATRRNGFEDVVAVAVFTPDLTDRATRLRTRILALRLSKYNLAGGGAVLPSVPEGREAVLVVGQVETDASIRLGGTGIKRNLDLLRAARAAFPDAFIIFKPHPDVLTGLREGGEEGETSKLANHIETAASAPDCLDWADRIVTITSLMGFEGLMRGKAVTTFGRPFYSGWGLSDDRDPPPRDRALSLDELTAAALILYPRYIDPVTKLPATPEVVVEALADEMAETNSLRTRVRTAWRGVVSWVMNRL